MRTVPRRIAKCAILKYLLQHGHKKLPSLVCIIALKLRHVLQQNVKIACKFSLYRTRPYSRTLTNCGVLASLQQSHDSLACCLLEENLGLVSK